MRRGQAIIEYLLIATVIIAALVAVQPAIRGAIDNLYNSAMGQTNNAANVLGSGQIP